jgi:hypothetical protein
MGRARGRSWRGCCRGVRIVFSEHTDQEGATVFRHACKLGLEGIVSKRLPQGPLALALAPASQPSQQDAPEAGVFRCVKP